MKKPLYSYYVLLLHFLAHYAQKQHLNLLSVMSYCDPCEYLRPWLTAQGLSIPPSKADTTLVSDLGPVITRDTLIEVCGGAAAFANTDDDQVSSMCSILMSVNMDPEISAENSPGNASGEDLRLRPISDLGTLLNCPLTVVEDWANKSIQDLVHIYYEAIETQVAYKPAYGPGMPYAMAAVVAVIPRLATKPRELALVNAFLTLWAGALWTPSRQDSPPMVSKEFKKLMENRSWNARDASWSLRAKDSGVADLLPQGLTWVEVYQAVKATASTVDSALDSCMRAMKLKDDDYTLGHRVLRFLIDVLPFDSEVVVNAASLTGQSTAPALAPFKAPSVLAQSYLRFETEVSESTKSWMTVRNAAGTEEMTIPLPWRNVSESERTKFMGLGDLAGFGLGKRTVVDETVRKATAFVRGRFATTFSLEHDLPSLINEIQKQLRPAHRGPIEVRPHKVNVYGPGGKFAAHADTHYPNLFGSLVVCFPSEFTGGEFVLRPPHEKERVLNWAPLSANHWQSIAFYSDMEHEIRPVTSGVRITMTFMLFDRPGAMMSASQLEALTRRTASKQLVDYFRSVKATRERMSASGSDDSSDNSMSKGSGGDDGAKDEEEEEEEEDKILKVASNEVYVGWTCAHHYAETRTCDRSILKGGDLEAYDAMIAAGLEPKIMSLWVGPDQDDGDKWCTEQAGYRQCDWPERLYVQEGVGAFGGYRVGEYEHNSITEAIADDAQHLHGQVFWANTQGPTYKFTYMHYGNEWSESGDYQELILLA